VKGLRLALCFVAALSATHTVAAARPNPAAGANIAADSSAPRFAAGADSNLPTLASRDERYRLCPTDVIALNFPLTPEFDETVSVGPDGFVSLVGADSVHLAGLTTEESANSVRAAYAKVLHDPIVNIELKDFNKPYFVVTGQVNRPGKYDLRGVTSATQAIAVAGGFTEAARCSQVLLFRRVNDEWYEVKSLNLKRILHGATINEDAQMHAGDMLYVPQNLISKIKRYIPSSGFGAYYELHP